MGNIQPIDWAELDASLFGKSLEDGVKIALEQVINKVNELVEAQNGKTSSNPTE